MSETSIAAQSRKLLEEIRDIQKSILAEIKGCSSAHTAHMLRKILDELNEQTHFQREDLALQKVQTALLAQILDALTSAPTLTASAPVRFSGDSVMADNTLVMNVGQTSTGTITPLLADGTTPSGGVVSNVTVTFSDPSATFVLNSDNTITFTGVAASTGAVSGTVAFTVTDTDTAVSQWSDAISVTVNGVVPPSQLTQSAPVIFSTPA